MAKLPGSDQCQVEGQESGSDGANCWQVMKKLFYSLLLGTLIALCWMIIIHTLKWIAIKGNESDQMGATLLNPSSMASVNGFNNNLNPSPMASVLGPNRHFLNLPADSLLELGVAKDQTGNRRRRLAQVAKVNSPEEASLIRLVDGKPLANNHLKRDEASQSDPFTLLNKQTNARRLSNKVKQANKQSSVVAAAIQRVDNEKKPSQNDNTLQQAHKTNSKIDTDDQDDEFASNRYNKTNQDKRQAQQSQQSQQSQKSQKSQQPSRRSPSAIQDNTNQLNPVAELTANFNAPTPIELAPSELGAEMDEEPTSSSSSATGNPFNTNAIGDQQNQNFVPQSRKAMPLENKSILSRAPLAAQSNLHSTMFYRAPFFTSWFISCWNMLFMPVFTLISSCCFRGEDSTTKRLLV